jgi:hypothetical protein
LHTGEYKYFNVSLYLKPTEVALLVERISKLGGHDPGGGKELH